jgi:hypothetical protein
MAFKLSSLWCPADWIASQTEPSGGHLMTDNWTAFCAFGKHPYRYADLDEPWDIVTTPRPQIKTRKSQMTLARALKRADKAGVTFRNAVVEPEGVELQLGETPPGNGHDQVDEWDEVLR